MDDKKIIYILGCGRSGSTILGFCLGNAVDTIDLGEVLDFARFSGHPNGFGPDTENYTFWDNIVKRIESSYGPVDFGKMLRFQSLFEKHYSFLPLFLFGTVLSPLGLKEYRKLLKSLYDSIFSQTQHHFYIDSSKYPTRLLHLISIYGPDAIKIIHLQRDPGSLASAFQKSEQSRKKTFIGSMSYFFLVNLFSVLACRLVPPGNRITIAYEDFIESPETSLGKIAKKFQLRVDCLIYKIETNLPLKRGFIFNGNRMRMQSNVVFKKRKPTPARLRSWQQIVSAVLKAAFQS